jgi:hypothetical protein
MVSFKKSLLVLSGICALMMAQQETFVEEKPVKRAPLSKARQEALNDLEALSHSLLSEIEQASQIVRDVIGAARDIAEGDSKSPCMQSLKKERTQTLEMIKKMQRDAQARIKALEQNHTFFKTMPTQNKKF